MGLKCVVAGRKGLGVNEMNEWMSELMKMNNWLNWAFSPSISIFNLSTILPDIIWSHQQEQ